MINYSIAMMGNPAKPDDPKKAYGVAQYTEKMTLEKFSEHISDHNSVYDAEDVQAILGKAVKCLREMLLAGKKVELGKLGEFYVTLQGKGTETADKYNPANCVEKVNVVWVPGKQFEDLKENAVFNLVANRDEQRAAIRRAKAQGDANPTDPAPGDSEGKGDSGSTEQKPSEGGSGSTGQKPSEGGSGSQTGSSGSQTGGGSSSSGSDSGDENVKEY